MSKGKSRFFSPFLLFLLYSILDPPDYIFFTYLYSVGRPCSIWTQSTARLYTSSQCALCAISEKSAGAQVRPSASVHLRVPSRVSSSPPASPLRSPPPPPPSRPPDPHGCSRHLESTTATFMGASCAVKGSKSHPCHCCSHLASPGASVQQQQQQQHHHHRHHHHHHETHHAHHQHHHHHHSAGKQPSAELQPQNNNGDCNILAPLRSKMKVLKKLKRKMGLGEPHPPTFLFRCFFLLLFLVSLFFFFFSPHRSPPGFLCPYSTRFNTRTLFASVRLLGALYRHVALRDFFKFRGVTSIASRTIFQQCWIC